MQRLSRNLIFFIFIFVVILAVIFGVMDKRMAATWSDSGDEPVLVIDPGHGGEDGGAVCGKIRESELNLQISQKLSALCELCGINYITTRDSEVIEYPDDLTKTASRKVYDQKRRLAIVNETPNAVLLSIHQNKYPASSPRGPQTFFAKSFDSEDFAKLLQLSMNTVLFPENRRIAVKIPDSIYLMKNVTCPAVLAECGFISNPTESGLLQDSTYQTKLALCMISSYCIYIENTFPS